MHGKALRRTAIARAGDGVPIAQIARSLGVSRAAIRTWVKDPDAALADRVTDHCFACAGAGCPHPESYAYLLGQHLGDGYLVTSIRVPKLSIACADAYPVISAMVDDAMYAMSGNVVGAVAGIGCSDHYCHWNHWPCLFPQHGPGRKHERPIELAPWQQDIVAEHPWSLIRGLIHSDGCRTLNRVVVHGRTYDNPRYFFSNESRDILAIMGAALDLVGVEWRYNRPNSISVVRRDAVETMDRQVGPKR